MEDCVPKIEFEMREMVKRHFTVDSLIQYAYLFLMDRLKEQLPFGRLTVLHYRMFGGEGAAVYRAAAAVEFLILATDIFDDLQDQDAPKQAWSEAPLPIALHLAAAFLTLSQQAMMDSEFDSSHVQTTMKMMNLQLLQAANGQMMDLMNVVSDEQSYFQSIKQKSAALIVHACMTGVMLTGRGWHPIVAEYAVEVGMAAQIKNDIRDLLRWDEKNDFLQRKKTLLTLYMLEDAVDQHNWIRDYFEGRLNEADVADKRGLLEEAYEKSGAMLYGSVVMRTHYNRFMELLESVPEVAVHKEMLLSILAKE
ncbi:competence protein ComQ [Paenibacillus algorifonticola]|uniref:Competence protein ComQ n=1 Tax=Paenibacillus algorifonticola TaxID=684063 RepID=A0A1I2EVC7_9BACL|nr:polyprenyl synthetase family protein [Paenibacillus algorifonticola]SFE97044.1 competence protein ComQ [Paenibacillus algorifonticola]